jgi:hypothetical protein
VSRLCDRKAASVTADGLDADRDSATLLLFGECQLESGLHAQTESLTDLVLVGRLLLNALLDGV